MPGDRPPAAPGNPAGNGAGSAPGAGPAPASKPRADRPPTGTTGRPPGRPTKNAKRAEHVEKLTARLTRGAVLVMLVDPLTSNAVLRHTPAIAEAAADVAEQYPWAAKFLDTTVKGGSLLGLGSAVGLLGLEIAANKGLLPPALNDMFSTEPAPETGPGDAPHSSAKAAGQSPAGAGAGPMSEAAHQARARLASFAR